MYFKYGSFTHTANDVDMTSLSIARQYSPRNRLFFKRHTLSMVGHLIASTQADIKSAIAALQAAYRYDRVAPGDGDAGLYHDDGTVSAHFLDTSKSINGIRVLHVTFPNGGDGEYATGRSYSVALQADFMEDFEDTIYSFEERISFQGGCGPSWELIPVAYGPPVLRVNALQTPQHIIQEGQALGIQAHPIPVGPLLPINYEHNDQRVWTFGGAQLIGRVQKLLYPTSWRYHFTSVADTSGLRPHPDYPGHY